MTPGGFSTMTLSRQFSNVTSGVLVDSSTRQFVLQRADREGSQLDALPPGSWGTQAWKDDLLRDPGVLAVLGIFAVFVAVEICLIIWTCCRKQGMGAKGHESRMIFTRRPARRTRNAPISTFGN